jgi:hypothetical protein
MNIIKIQDQLKGVPDNTLVGYVQNPTGQVPTYLALSELQRRKEMRASYQANKPEDKTVAEDLVEEAQPQPGIAALPEGQPMQQAMAPQPEMPVQQMAQGGLADLAMDNQMFNEENFATGGIVAFAKGGSPDEYGVTMPIVPTMDDMSMQTLAAQKAFGVDPDFYKKTLEESNTERLKELEEAKKMDQAQLLLSMGSAFAGTPTFGKALSVAGEKAAPIIGAMAKNQRDINSVYKMADRKSLEAQYAQARGDAQGAQKAINDKENLLLNAQLKEAELNSKKAIAAAKATGDQSKLDSMIKIQAAKIGEQKFINAYPSGSVSGYLGDNQALTQFIRNRFIKDTENYLRNDIEAPIPSEQSLIKEFEALYPSKKTDGKATNKPAAKPASTVNGPNSLLNIPRPANIQKIIDKHASNQNKRYITTNTDEELNTPWDLAGTNEDEDSQ